MQLKQQAITMACLIYRLYNERALRRERVVRDRTNPLDMYNDEELIQRFCFSRVEIFSLVDEAPKVSLICKLCFPPV